MARMQPQGNKLAELEAQAQAKERELSEIKRAIQMARGEEMKHFIERVRSEIAASGFDYDAVTSALTRPRRKGGRHRSGRRKSWRLKSDPDCVYSGQGQLPFCVMLQMRREGLDPQSRDDRTKFFAEHMEQMEAND